MTSYRSRLEIVADVLSVMRDSAKKTKIMYQANLSYKLLTRYLQYVLDAGLARIEGENCYEPTAKGFEFLRQFNDYHERSKQLQTQLTRVKRKKELLENTFLNNEERARGE